MKKLTAIIALISLVAFSLPGEAKRNFTTAELSPVIRYVDENSELSKWFIQYMETTSGKVTFEDFLKRLSTSEVLLQRSKSAGITHNQLYSPIVTLLGKDWDKLDELTNEEHATIKITMVELDIVLAAILATMPQSAHEEFRREVLRGAKPLTEVAKLPETAVEAMRALTLPEHELSDRLNQPNPQLSEPRPRDPQEVVQPTNIPSGYYRGF